MGQQGAGKTTLLKELLRKSPIKRRITVDTLGEHDKGLIVTHPKQLIRAAKLPAFDIAVRFDNETDGFIWACRVARAAKECLLVVDEIDMYSNAHKAPASFSWLVRYGRHNAVHLICIARRPADLWKTLRANANNIYMLRIVDPDDAKYLGTFIGKDLAEHLKDLKDLEYYCWQRGDVSYGRTRF